MGVLKFYTDGACSQNGTWEGGWAYIMLEDDSVIKKGFGYSKKTTNNIMEMLAFTKALEEASSFSGKIIEIYSDSAYILNCFSQRWYVNWRKNGWRNSKGETVANKQLWIQLIDLYETVSINNNIQLIKVKGHSGNKYNEEVDQLAVAALKRGER